MPGFPVKFTQTFDLCEVNTCVSQALDEGCKRIWISLRYRLILFGDKPSICYNSVKFSILSFNES